MSFREFVDVFDGLVELQSGVHEHGSDVQSRIHGEEHRGEGVLPSGEGDHRGEGVLLHGLPYEVYGLVPPLLDDPAVGLHRIVPGMCQIR